MTAKRLQRHRIIATLIAICLFFQFQFGRKQNASQFRYGATFQEELDKEPSQILEGSNRTDGSKQEETGSRFLPPGASGSNNRRLFLDPRDFHHYPPLKKIVLAIQPNNITLNLTNNEEQERKLVVDVMSSGSQTRLHFMDGQVKSWASHSYVRHFWGFSELDDIDPNCSETIGRPLYHFRTCKRVLPKPSDSALMKYFQRVYGSGTRQKPPGWLCAQTRFGQALGRVGAEYRKRIRQLYNGNNSPSSDIIHSAVSSVLPDYLFLVDDDTYLNVDIIANDIHSELNTTIKTHNNTNQKLSLSTTPSLFPRAYAGCASFDSRVNITVPIGGLAVFLTKGSVLRLITPIFCNRTAENDDDSKTFVDHLEKELRQFQAQACQRIQQNILLERDRFVEGMSISDLSYELSKSAPDFCLNSDWLYGYLISYYYLSDPIPFFSKFSRVSNFSDGFHLHPFRNSLKKFRKQQGGCKLDSVEACMGLEEKPFVCHYQTPESMLSVLSKN